MSVGPVIRNSLHGDVDNASRAGALAKMTMEELNSAVKHDDEYVVHACDQKTFATHGPA